MEINSKFKNMISGSSAIISSRQKEVAPKTGELSVQVRLKNYVGITEETGASYPSDTVPGIRKTTSKDKKSTWNKDIDAWTELMSAIATKDKCEITVDEKTGEKLFNFQVDIKHWGQKEKDYLKEKAEHVWSHEDPDSMWLRNFVNEDGSLPSSYTRSFKAGSMIKVGMPDRQNNVLRDKAGDGGALYKVQPDAPLRLYKVFPESYLQLRTEEVKEEGEAADNGEKKAMDTTDEPVFEQRRMEVRLSVSFKLKCKGYVTLDQENYNPLLERSERMHYMHKKDVHNLVPVDELRVNTKAVARSAYYYISSGYQTESNGSDDQVGVCIMRDGPTEGETHLDVKNFMQERDGEAPVSKLRFSASIIQYKGEPNLDAADMYNATFISKSTNEDMSLKLGIMRKTTVLRYASIMSANWDLPMHVEAEPWVKSILDNPANDPKDMNDKPELERLRGLYTLGAKTVIFDLLRYFKGSGIKVSPEWVEQDFAASEQENRKTGKRSISLKPYNSEKRNPINAGGIQGAILSVGNGKMYTCDITGEEKPINHAWDGNLLTILQGGKHDFFVLTSHAMTLEERQQHARGVYGDFADEWVDSLTHGDNGAFYNIYAVLRDAKMAPDLKKTPILRRKAQTASPKRERDSEEEEEEESPVKKNKEEQSE